jgi:hypothetical protein
MEPQPMDVDATGPYLSGYSTPPELQQDMDFVMEDVAYLVNESEERSKNEKKDSQIAQLTFSGAEWRYLGHFDEGWYVP